MTDLEISKRLALAIGWNGNCVRAIGDGVYIWVEQQGWRKFDYRDWNVIGPIAAEYDCFPYALTEGRWCSTWLDVDFMATETIAETPQKAIALAVIDGLKNEKLQSV